MGGASTKKVEALETQTNTLERKVRDQESELKRHQGLISDIQLRQAARPPTPVTSDQVKDMMSVYTLQTETTDILDKIRAVEMKRARTEPILDALQEKASAVDKQLRIKPVDDLVTFQDLEAQIPEDRLKHLEAVVERLLREMQLKDEQITSQKAELHELAVEVNATGEELKSQQVRMRETERLEDDTRKLTLKLESSVRQGWQNNAALESERNQLLAELELSKQVNEQTINDLETQKECLSRDLENTRASTMQKIQHLEARDRLIEYHRKSTTDALGLLREHESSQRVEELRWMKPSQETTQRQNMLMPEIDL